MREVTLHDRTYRVYYNADGIPWEVRVCGVRMRERGQPKGAWVLDGERRIPKNGPTWRAAIAAAQSAAAHKGE